MLMTNFTGTVSATYDIPLESLGEPRNIEIMRAVFHNPEALRPGRTSTTVTQDAARHFAEIAAAMRQRGLDPAAVAHFLDRIVFCLFAEDTGLLPNMVFTRIVERSRGDPARFCKILGQLFDTMATGGDFGLESIRYFNGNLFDDPPTQSSGAACPPSIGSGVANRTVLALSADEMKRIAVAAELDWSSVDPSIFGTLFERGLDPAKRSQLGAHFTSRSDIELVVDAVIMTVLRREWVESRDIINTLLTTGRKTPTTSKTLAKTLNAAVTKKAKGEAGNILLRFLDRLQHVRILDPACGSGNFLYVALLRLKDLEKEVILFGNDNGLGAFLPMVDPSQLYGIEINPYAHDLAQMTVWIGWLQWIRVNGFGFPADPILRSLTGLPRFVATTRVSKFRLFAWLNGNTLPDSALIVFARSDDLFFGVLHSHFHEVWALRMGTRLETRPRYTPSTCFETFPFPPGVLDNAPTTPTLAAISAAAKDLNELRENWLNPSEWTRTETLEFPGTVGGPWDRYIDMSTVTDRGSFKVGAVRYPRLVPRDAECAARLKNRTLTKLYNERPAWLAACHAKLDAAVAAAYGWPVRQAQGEPGDLTDDQILERLLALNQAATS